MPRTKKSSSTKSKSKWPSPQGFKDILPENQKYWDFILSKVKESASDYRYQKIETPLVEKEDLFVKIIGEESKLIQENLYKIEDKQGQKLVLRPEVTIQAARSYLEHAMFNQPQPTKLWYWSSVFRQEDDFLGKHHHACQFGFEVFGSQTPDSDAELIMMLNDFYQTFNFEYEIEINSIGCSECRREYAKKLAQHLKGQKICNTCQKRTPKNILHVFNCTDKKCQAALADAPQITDFLCDDCKKHFMKVLEELDDAEVVYNFNPLLFHEYDYYTRTIFKILVKGKKDYQLVLGTGGRYDNLVEDLGGKTTPAIGYAGYVERLVARLKEKGLEVKENTKCDVFVAQIGETAKKKSLKLFNELKKEGVKVKEAFAANGLTEQLETAQKVNAKFSLIMGQKEVIDQTIIIRDMESGVQEIVDYENIIPEIKKRLLNVEGNVKIYTNNLSANSQSKNAKNS